ncbi:MAG: antibiotic biosynthesis monooxygenase [Alphaproteobacteria bacterium]
MRLTLSLAATLLAAAMTQAQAQAPAGPIYVAAYAEVGTNAVKDGIALLKQFRDMARKEDGNMGLDIAQELGRTNRFLILGIWKDQAALEAHGRFAGTTAFTEKFKAVQNAPIDVRVHNALSVADSGPAGKGAVYVASHVDVPPPRKDEIIAALNPLATESRKGAGNQRFDVWQQTSRPNHFTVIEAWKDQKAYDARGLAAPQRTFRDKLGPMLGALYDERLYRSID